MENFHQERTLEIVLKGAVGQEPAVSIKYGLFINKLINFLVVACSMFFVIKMMNRLSRRQASKQ